MSDNSVPIALAQTQHEQATDHLESTIRQYLSKYKYVYEKRLQNSLFWLDYNYALEHNEPYTDANYYTHMYGVFSPEISYLLREVIDLPTDLVYQNDVRVPKYLCYTLQTKSPPICDPSVIEWAYNNTKTTSTDELITENSTTTLYQTTPSGQKLSLETLSET